ncbi:hypothetical protein BKA66DRAFT_85719 [Pyrenochaeta sp. MPI-SDFR-AT-0127]|nr:hypothetical protein BKA66DRAFT_85719 [Pyrenochaeta sp. MPI-SDFR-AT-0127]
MSIDCSATAKPCLLLDLPGEIRNLIYDLAIDDKYIPPLSLPIEIPEHDLRGLWFKAHENYLLRPYELYLSRINASASAPREFPAIREVEEGEMDSKKVIQPFCSLTQVCRKIRSEYLPFYQRINTYYVCHLDLQDYLDYVLREECKQAACQYADSLYDPLSDQIDRRQYLNRVHEEELAYRQRMIRNIRINCRLWDERVGRGRDRNYNKESAVDILPFLNFCATAPGIRVKWNFLMQFSM